MAQIITTCFPKAAEVRVREGEWDKYALKGFDYPPEYEVVDYIMVERHKEQDGYRTTLKVVKCNGESIEYYGLPMCVTNMSSEEADRLER